MASMNLKQIIVDSLRYSASDFKIVVILGIVLLLADIAYNLSDRGELASELRLILIFCVVIISVFEAGYVFRILEESINGSSRLPKFNNLKVMFFHGVKEIILLIIYYSVPLILFGALFTKFLFSNDINDVPDGSEAIFICFLSLTAIIYAFYPAVLLHRAHHNGDFRSSFDFKKILHKVRSIGLKRLIVVYIGILIIVSLVKLVLSESLSAHVPIFGELLSDLIITPYVLIFTTRVLGLIDEP